MKIIGIGGEPATGKSTLMKSIISHFGDWQAVEWNQVRGIVSPSNKLFVLGIYHADTPFVGTDRLSMNVQPLAEYFLRTMATKDWADFTVLFEGDRLFNGKFLTFCQQNFECRFLVLETDEQLKKKRHAKRDNQNATWLLGRKTKIVNMIAQFKLETLKHNTPGDTETIANLILSPDIWR